MVLHEDIPEMEMDEDVPRRKLQDWSPPKVVVWFWDWTRGYDVRNQTHPLLGHQLGDHHQDLCVGRWWLLYEIRDIVT